MQFVYIKEAGRENLTLSGEAFQHLYKARRTKHQARIVARNLVDSTLYTYEAMEVGRREASLRLVEREVSVRIPSSDLHLIWAITEAKSVEKSLPALNELGVAKITFFYAAYSQRQIVFDRERLLRILIHSCEQCGRSALMELETFDDLDEVMGVYSDFGVMDFGGEELRKECAPSVMMIGPEGGFSDHERERLKGKKRFSTGGPLILQSETAALLVAARVG